MTSSATTPLAERLLHFLKHLGIERAHLAARNVGDWHAFATAYPDRITSLSLVCPSGAGSSALWRSRSAVIGDQRRPWSRRRARAGCRREHSWVGIRQAA